MTVDSSISGKGGLLEKGRDAVEQALRDMPEAKVRYPTKEEGDKMWAALIAQRGPPPMQTNPIVLMMDGTPTKLKGTSDEKLQRLFIGTKVLLPSWSSISPQIAFMALICQY